MDLILFEPTSSDRNSEALDFDQLSRTSHVMNGGVIETISFSFGIKRVLSTDVSNSSRISGRPLIGDISLLKYVDRSSLTLYQACLIGKPIATNQEVTKIHVFHKSDKEGVKRYLTIVLTDVLVNEIEAQSNSDDRSTELIKLNFTEIQWIYNLENADGSSERNSFTWNLARNRPGEMER